MLKIYITCDLIFLCFACLLFVNFCSDHLKNREELCVRACFSSERVEGHIIFTQAKQIIRDKMCSF